MAPRKYSMGKRTASVEDTRRRIVEATLTLHSQKGIFDTSWKDIAEHADVSVATVYKHFPSLDELVPACGALIMAMTRPPTLEDAGRVFGLADTTEERLARLVSELFDFYERAGPYLEVGPKERQLPAVQAWESGMQTIRASLVREALRSATSADPTVRAVSALLAFPVFQSLSRHDFTPEEAEAVVMSMLLCWLNQALTD